jgi:flavin-binding protein dodecin
MKHNIYKHIEITGTSSSGIEDAINWCLQRAHETVKNLRWFELMETRGTIERGQVKEWQVTIKAGFTVED